MSRLSKFIRSKNKKLCERLIAARPYTVKAWRPLFVRTTFVGATGSHGKTTATIMLAKILRTKGRTYFHQGFNELPTVLMNLMRARPWRQRFFVQEVSGHRPGAVEECVKVLRPSVGVVTAISGDHRKAFEGSFEAVTIEKSALVNCLPSNGLAVLNADDPFVASMAADSPCRVVWFGRKADADLRLVDARSCWPERLILDVEYKGQPFTVKTQLVGEHWVTSVMAALLTALEMGVPTANCLRAIEAVSPAYNRMSVHPGPNGARYVLDAYKSSFFGIQTCLQFVARAVAPRKTVLFGTISDYPGSSKSHYYKVARMGLAVADRVIFTGRNAERVRRLAADEFAGRLFTAELPADALRIIEDNAVPDELIYVKATRVDKLARLLVPIRKTPATVISSTS